MTDLDPSSTSKASSPQWHLHIPPDTYGPYSLQQLRDYAREGRMTADTLVWTEGAEGWARAGDQAALRAFFKVMAPPPPAPPAPQPAAAAKPAAAKPSGSSYVLGASGSLASAAVATGAAANAVAANSLATVQETSAPFLAAAPAPGGRIGFLDAARLCLQVKYVDFSGRARRAEFWWFALFASIVMFVVYSIAGWLALSTSSEGSMTLPGILALVVGGLVVLALLPPSIAVAVRRLHDLGWSGWWYLAQFIPVVGGLVALAMLIGFMMRGTVGPNPYGPDPLAGDV